MVEIGVTNYLADLKLARDGATTDSQNKAIHLIDQVEYHHYQQHVQLVRLPRGAANPRASQHGQGHRVFGVFGHLAIDHVSKRATPINGC